MLSLKLDGVLEFCARIKSRGRTRQNQHEIQRFVLRLQQRGLETSVEVIWLGGKERILAFDPPEDLHLLFHKLIMDWRFLTRLLGNNSRHQGVGFAK